MLCRDCQNHDKRGNCKNKHSVKSKPVIFSDEGPNARDSKGSEMQQWWLTLQSRYPRSHSKQAEKWQKREREMRLKWLWTPGELKHMVQSQQADVLNAQEVGASRR